MSDPTDIAAQVAITGVSALIVSLIGVEPQGLVWAFVGSTLGVSVAKPTTRLYAIALFIAATLTCALLATMAADQWFRGSHVARNTFSVILGAAFHPLFSSFIESIPGIVQWAVDFFKRRIGGLPADKGDQP